MMTKLLDRFIHEWLEHLDTWNGEMAHHWPLQSSVRSRINFAKHVVCNFSIDQGAANLVEVTL